MYGGRPEDMYPPPPGMGGPYTTPGSGGPYGYPGQPQYGPPGGGYPPPQNYGPPPSGGYPPPGGGYPPPGGGYPPPGGGYPFPGPYGPSPQNIPMHQMGTSNNDPEYNSDFTGFSNEEVRRNFVYKVYSILTVQLIITAAIVYPFLYVDKFVEFAIEHRYLMFVFAIVNFIIMMILCCVESARRTLPTNMILLVILTISTGFLCGFISTRYKTEVVFLTLALTALVCLIVTFIACCAPIDITGCGMLMCVLGVALMVFGIVAMLLATIFKIKILLLVYSGLAVAVFSLYLMYDTQQIMGGKRQELSPEEYVFGAVMLYVDIINIFQNLLPLVSAFCSDD